MEIEVTKLKAEMQILSMIKKANMECCEGILENKKVVVGKSGIGKENARAEEHTSEDQSH